MWRYTGERRERRKGKRVEERNERRGVKWIKAEEGKGKRVGGEG